MAESADLLQKSLFILSGTCNTLLFRLIPLVQLAENLRKKTLKYGQDFAIFEKIKALGRVVEAWSRGKISLTLSQCHFLLPVA
jgi:hypothetical protein